MRTKTFWMVYVEDESTPTYIHESEESAQKEAERLTETYGKTSYILKAIKEVEVAPKTITIEVLEENMKSTLAYYEIISISETPIMEVLKYELK
jgi:hypothetical protein